MAKGGTRPELDEAQRRDLLRVVDGVRRAIEAAVTLNAPAEALSALASQAQALADALATHATHAGERPLPRYARKLDLGDLNGMLPFSPISGRYNPLAPPMEMSLLPGPPQRVIGEVSFGEAYEGPPACVHGSIIAAVYDQLLALAPIVHDAAGPTATLTVHFRRLTPLHTPLRFEAWVERIEGRKAFVRGTCHAGGDLLSEGEGVFVAFAPRLD